MDNATLAYHYLKIHNEQVPVTLEFKYDSDDDVTNRDDYQQRKKWKEQQNENVYEAVDENEIRQAQMQNHERINDG